MLHHSTLGSSVIHKKRRIEGGLITSHGTGVALHGQHLDETLVHPRTVARPYLKGALPVRLRNTRQLTDPSTYKSVDLQIRQHTDSSTYKSVDLRVLQLWSGKEHLDEALVHPRTVARPYLKGAFVFNSLTGIFLKDNILPRPSRCGRATVRLFNIRQLTNPSTDKSVIFGEHTNPSTYEPIQFGADTSILTRPSCTRKQ